MANIETYSFIFFFQNGGEESCSIYIAGLGFRWRWKRKQISFSTVWLFHLYFCFPAAVEGTAVAVASILKMTVSDFFHANHIHSNKNIRMRTKTFECVINDSKWRPKLQNAEKMLSKMLVGIANRSNIQNWPTMLANIY